MKQLLPRTGGGLWGGKTIVARSRTLGPHVKRSVSTPLLRLSLFCVLLSLPVSNGCSGPSRANIALRKENQQLKTQVAELERARKAAQGSRYLSTRPTDGVDLDRLYVASDLSFGKLTLVEADQLSVYVVPTDQFGDSLKAAGAFQVLAYDLSRGSNALVGQWTFTPEQTRSLWNGKGLLYTYVLPCPLVEQPSAASDKIRLRVTFQDLLTGRNITAETDARIVR